MRNEKKLNNGNVLVNWNSDFFNMYIRKPGSANKELFNMLLSVDPVTNKIKIKAKTAKEYGIEIEEV